MSVIFPNLMGGVDIFVIPGIGAYAYLSASIMSLILGHVQIHYHRHASFLLGILHSILSIAYNFSFVTY